MGASRTRVPRWTPPFVDAVRLAWRPIVAYNVFVALGSLVMLLTAAWYAHRNDKDVIVIFLGLAAGVIGVLLGQAIALLRFRALPVFMVTTFCGVIAIWMLSQSHAPGGEYVAIPILFFIFAFPCGLLSLMHRYELIASFWPAVGWIGGVFIILNEEGRVHTWEESKVKAWLPVPLAYLAGFLLCWLVYLAAKQATRVEMWQALSGAMARRVSRKKETRVSALPRRNILPLLVLTLLLFGGVAVLAPYLWRTGKGDHETHKPHEGKENEKPLPEPPPIDGEGIMRQMQKLADAAKETLPKLWPLLFLLVLYRPAKRALLLTHLKAPITPTPPSERIDNLWEYIRIAAEDVGIVPTASDSVEGLLKRVPPKLQSPALVQAAEIYIRTRYGFTVKKGDAMLMRLHATQAAKDLRRDQGGWNAFTSWWRGLS